MKKTAHTARSIRERAALYTAGALPEAERIRFETHLRDGCAECAAEVLNFAEALPALALAEAEPPPVGLRKRVLARVAAERALRESPVLETRGQRFVRSESLAWSSGSSPGIEVKTILVDRVNQRVTRMIRMQAGAVIRPHRHVGVEESFLLDGELLVDGVLMQSGDYCRAEVGSEHRVVCSAGGCVFIATSAIGDELLSEIVEL